MGADPLKPSAQSVRPAPQPFARGEVSPFLSAGRLNARIMNPIIALWAMQGRNGVRVVRSDTGFIIELEDRRLSNTPGSGEGGGLTWGGEWFDTDWPENVVVIRDTAADIDDGNVAGTYVALQDVPQGTPAPGESGAEDYWDLLARGNWDRLVLRFGNIFIDIDAPNGRFRMKDSVTLSEIDMRLSDCAGKRLYIQEVPDCSTGVPLHRRALASDPY